MRLVQYENRMKTVPLSQLPIVSYAAYVLRILVQRLRSTCQLESVGCFHGSTCVRETVAGDCFSLLCNIFEGGVKLIVNSNQVIQCQSLFVI